MDPKQTDPIARRDFLKVAGLAAAASAIPLAAPRLATGAPMQEGGKPMPFELPKLPYAFDALEPHIDAMTMQIHHDKHHQAYVDNLNKALVENPDLAKKSIEDLIGGIDKVPDGIRTAVQNNGGGHLNHSMFWTIMKPKGGGDPTGKIADVIKSTFTDFATFKTKINDAGMKRFGSGWSWLVKTKDGKFDIVSTANQDSPWMKGDKPILGVDVWEHAYYLKYQNKRADYLNAWWNTINWDAVNARM
ncbi:MAG: superoxide dismutase [Planctomycetes bacterium]|nr:superoxide dismutase [Planctomycetota bacterium]MBI3847666.1 superoxide dismutase [Planctomycetota bacterium]